MNLVKHLFSKHLSETIIVLALLIISVYFFARNAPAYTGELEAPTGLTVGLNSGDFPPAPNPVN